MANSQPLQSTAPVGATRYSLLLTRDEAEVRAAQALRHRVFADELGAVLRTGVAGLDIDRFDEHCDHLVVRADNTGEIVGTYRLLPPQGAARAGGLYCETEFDLAGVGALRDGLVELGRACVHPDHRSGAVLALVWTGIARYLLLTGHRWVVGCASVPLHTPGSPDGALAAAVWDLARTKHLAPPAYRVRPHLPWATDAALLGASRPVLPPLLRGYLRLGAWVCGPPAHDFDFATADFLVLLCLDTINSRYLSYLLGEGR